MAIGMAFELLTYDFWLALMRSLGLWPSDHVFCMVSKTWIVVLVAMAVVVMK